MLVGEVSDVDEMGLADIPSLHGSQLERVVRVKYLGVLIQGDGEWMSHWEMVETESGASGKYDYAAKWSISVGPFCGDCCNPNDCDTCPVIWCPSVVPFGEWLC